MPALSRSCQPCIDWNRRHRISHEYTANENHYGRLVSASGLVRHDASEQSVIDATCVVVDAQRQLGIDLSRDGELYRFAVHHPDTNGMIDYFIRPLDGVRSTVGCGDCQAFAVQKTTSFRAKPLVR